MLQLFAGSATATTLFTLGWAYHTAFIQGPVVTPGVGLTMSQTIASGVFAGGLVSVFNVIPAIIFAEEKASALKKYLIYPAVPLGVTSCFAILNALGFTPPGL